MNYATHYTTDHCHRCEAEKQVKDMLPKDGWLYCDTVCWRAYQKAEVTLYEVLNGLS